MKRWEVTRHLVEGDFPWIHPRYWCLSVVRTMWVNACPGLYGSMPGQCIQPLLFSASMIAHVLTNDEYLTRVCIVQNEIYGDCEIVLLYIAPFHDPANAFLHAFE